VAFGSHGPPHEVDGDNDEDDEGAADGHHRVHPYVDLLWEVFNLSEADGLRHRHLVELDEGILRVSSKSCGSALDVNPM